MIKRLYELEFEMYSCIRCSLCKFIPLPVIENAEFSKICPAIEDRNFHAYSGAGKIAISYAVLRGAVDDFSDEALDAIYRCTMCGACDVMCRQNMGEFVDVNEILHALRIRCVENGYILPEHEVMVENLRKEDNPFGEPKSERGRWAEGLKLKNAVREKVDVLFHAGCRFSYDAELQPIARANAEILMKAGLDVGIAGREEACCGLRAFDVGYLGEMEKYAEDMTARLQSSGASVLTTPCADCYSAFKYYYPWIGREMDVEVLHTTEVIERLIKDGKIEFTKEIPMVVTYHDPCHLGRLGERYVPWKGEYRKVLGQFYITDPPKPLRTGTKGVYDAPRNILRAIPGIELVEMQRIREYSWCCGAGGGCYEAFPDFTIRTAAERIREAKSVGAEAIVTACPWCERAFRDAAKAGEKIEVYDISQLVLKAIG